MIWYVASIVSKQDALTFRTKKEVHVLFKMMARFNL